MADSALTIRTIAVFVMRGKRTCRYATPAFYSSPRRAIVDAVLASFAPMIDNGPGTRLHLSGDDMPLCEHGATETRRNYRSRLGESLLRLHQNLDQTRSTEQVAEHQFHQWQERWSDRKEQIARRLDLIDRQLESLVQMHQRRPQLSLVVAQPHDDEHVAVAR